MTDSMSSPTYPACVKVVQSQMANGTSRQRARICAKNVLPAKAINGKLYIYDTIQLYLIQYNKTVFDTIQLYMMQYNTTVFDTIRYNTTVFDTRHLNKAS